MTVEEKALSKVKGGNGASNGSKNGGGPMIPANPATMKGLKTTQITGFLSKYKLQVEAALPQHIKPERMIQIITTLVARNPKLAQCTTESLIGAMLTTSMLGLEPIPQFGQAYFIPFRNKHNGGREEVQFILGYRGMVQLMLRHPSVKEVYAVAVHANDQFHYEEGLNRDIKHVPCTDGDPGELTHVYAVLKTSNGGTSYVVMSKREIEKARSYSLKKKDGPWQDNYEEMALKSALRRLFKWAPVATDVLTSIGLDGKVIHQQNASKAIQNDGVFEDTFDFDDAEEAEVIEEESQPAENPAPEVLLKKLKYYFGSPLEESLQGQQADEWRDLKAKPDNAIGEDEANDWLDLFQTIESQK